MLMIKDIDNLILYGTFSELFFIFISISSVLYFRYTRPNAIRPIKVRFHLFNCKNILFINLS